MVTAFYLVMPLLFKNTHSVRRGASPQSDLPTPRVLPHWLAVAMACAGVALVTLAVSTPQEAANLVEDPSTTSVDMLQPVVVTAQPLDLSSDEFQWAERFQWSHQTVRNGDNLSLIFARAGLTDRDVYEVTRTDNGRALRKIYPGETIGFKTSDDGQLLAVKHIESRLRWTTYSRSENGRYQASVTERTPELRQQTATMEITSSLFLAGQSAGLSQRLIMDLAGIFGGVVDFALDPRVGDTIELVFEEKYLDGEKLEDGAILAAAFTNKGETFEAYRYTDSQGDIGYYNAEGVSMRKAFLRAPVDFTRVSSNFNPNRLHPIYKTKRPHRGTDYAAPTGTPVYAAGDGRVVEAGYTRANGNYVFIQHGESYKTHYLHLHKRQVKQGQRVKQGELIGSVGSTGAATGPHLHYEFLVNGVHRNPRTVHKILPKAKSLPKTELARFQSHIQQPEQQLAALQRNAKLALSSE